MNKSIEFVFSPFDERGAGLLSAKEAKVLIQQVGTQIIGNLKAELPGGSILAREIVNLGTSLALTRAIVPMSDNDLLADIDTVIFKQFADYRRTIVHPFAFSVFPLYTASSGPFAGRQPSYLHLDRIVIGHEKPEQLAQAVWRDIDQPEIYKLTRAMIDEKMVSLGENWKPYPPVMLKSYQEPLNQLTESLLSGTSFQMKISPKDASLIFTLA